MGGEGYALERAQSDATLPQFKSRENRARSGFPRRSPSKVDGGVLERGVENCMEVIASIPDMLVQGARFLARSVPASLNILSPPWMASCSRSATTQVFSPHFAGTRVRQNRKFVDFGGGPNVLRLFICILDIKPEDRWQPIGPTRQPQNKIARG